MTLYEAKAKAHAIHQISHSEDIKSLANLIFHLCDYLEDLEQRLKLTIDTANAALAASRSQ